MSVKDDYAPLAQSDEFQAPKPADGESEDEVRSAHRHKQCLSKSICRRNLSLALCCAFGPPLASAPSAPTHAYAHLANRPHLRSGSPTTNSLSRPSQVLERAFWRQLPYRPPVYGADVEGSLFDPGVPWSIANMDTILRRAPSSPRPVPAAPRFPSPYITLTSLSRRGPQPRPPSHQPLLLRPVPLCHEPSPPQPHAKGRQRQHPRRDRPLPVLWDVEGNVCVAH